MLYTYYCVLWFLENAYTNFVSQAQEISIFLWGLQINSPSWFFQGLWLPGSRVPPHGEECVTSLRRSAWEAVYVLSWFSTCLLWTGFSLWLHSTKKRMQSNVDWSESFGRAKTNYFTAKHMYIWDGLFAIAHLISRSFDSGTSVVCLVRKRDDLLWLNTWDKQLLFCSRTGLALTLGCRLWDVNCGN